MTILETFCAYDVEENTLGLAQTRTYLHVYIFYIK